MSEAVTIRCVGCDAKLRVKSRKADGRKITCPKCEQQFVIQLPSETLSDESPGPEVPTAAAGSPAAQATAVAPVPTAQVVPTDSAAAPAADAQATVEGSVVSWEEGIGDDKKFHIAHISPAGITHVLKIKDYAKFTQAVAAVNASPSDATEILLQLPKARQIRSDELSRVTYTETLSQLILLDDEGQKTKIPEGKEQADFFAAIQQHLGGAASEEEADAWAVMQSPLFILSVIAVIGGFMIWFTTICDPNYEASGRRSGMKQLMNWVGYKIGPFWMSVAVGGLAALVLAMMIYNLIKRPIRQVLEFT